MASEHALIVDDSKTAQHRLKRMLENFDLTIDIVSSAEEALAFLSYNHPAVIFLDHHMTGMSGMDALKTIKANPGTALIPVIMYTSEQDDLFVGQAIALGALDILSKGTMQPSNLERVLKSLNIYERISTQPEEIVKIERRTTPIIKPPALPPPAQVAHMSDLQQIRSQIGKLFEIHITQVRNQINASTQLIVKRVSTNLENKSRKESISEPNLRAADNIAQAEANSKNTLITHLLLVALLLGMCFFTFQLFQIQGNLQYTSTNIQGVIESKNAETRVITAALDKLAGVKKTEADQAIVQTLLRTISIIQNTDFHFNYGEPPLNAHQLSNLTTVISLLAQAGYTGQMIVEVNFGNVCLEPDVMANSWRLARSEMPATSCRMLKELNSKFAVADLTTPAYQNFQQTLQPIQDGRIRIRLSSAGLSTPRTEYPIIRTSTTAGEWNRVALKNNRISIQFPG